MTVSVPRRATRAPVYWQAHGRGPALILINGYAASARTWPRDWVRGLEQRFRVIRLDNRGSGFSRFVDTPFTIADLADDVVRVMDEAETPSATIFGISMGGMIAQELALRHPERAPRLILAGSRPPNPAFQLPSLYTRWVMVRPPMPGESLRQYFIQLWSYSAAPGFAEAHPAVIEELTEQTLERPTPRAMLIHQGRAMGSWGHAERLASITAPTLIVHGRLDALAPVENGRRLATLIPGARYVELEQVGHLIPQEAPKILAGLIAEHAKAS